MWTWCTDFILRWFNMRRARLRPENVSMATPYNARTASTPINPNNNNAQSDSYRVLPLVLSVFMGDFFYVV